MKKKKIGKAEDFIGWKSDDGLLEVVGIYGRQWTGAVLYTKLSVTGVKMIKSYFR